MVIVKAFFGYGYVHASAYIAGFWSSHLRPFVLSYSNYGFQLLKPPVSVTQISGLSYPNLGFATSEPSVDVFILFSNQPVVL